MTAAAPSAQTLKLRALTDEVACLRAGNRAAIRTLPAVVAETRQVVDDARAELRRRLERERQRGATRSVLVVDDDHDQRELMLWALAHDLNVPVRAAAGVAEGRRLFEKYRPAVVVVDLLLANGERGDEFIASLGRTRAVLVSGADVVTLRTAAGPCNAIPLSRDDLAHLPEMVRGLLDVLHPPLWCRSTRDRFLVVSDDLAATLGYAPAEMVGRGWREYVHPDDLAKSEAQQRDGGGKGVVGHVQRMRARDGSWVSLSWDVAPLTDGELYAIARVV